MPGERPDDTRFEAREQWIVVEKVGAREPQSQHRWKMVTLRNGAGKLSAGLQCMECGEVERITERQYRSHGQRIERSKD